MRILIRTSKWAIWARRFGSFAVPLLVVPVLMHREQLIESPTFAIVEAVALGVAVLAVVIAFGAFVRLWFTGDQGWARAFFGLCFGLVVIAPFGWFGYQAWRYPLVSEVSTNPTNPPALITARPAPTPPALRAEIAGAFPDARTHTYAIDATQIFDIVAGLVDDRGWDVRVSRTPSTPLDSGEIDAVATTLVGWRDEVAIRVAGTASGSVVDVRAAPLHAFPDFGENGRTIEDLLQALDQKITLLLRNAPLAPAAPDSDSDTAPDTDAPPAADGG